ncbi:hypothetical protein COJ21_25875 [Priestia megaterium]|uniref:DUF1330 domain-containing protein n=1 Tax=Priestia megaterium TaxID=1404 RepID=UPI000BF63A33|nr:DUF1330 domain-containing protein [Priestia megaterium]PFK64690.1 hypothetical protein COJ21_25875 [Priestia megaterium]
MTAYVVFIRENTTNPSQLEIYAEKSPAGLKGHPVTPRAVYGKHLVLEGPKIEGAVILEFPTFEEANAWYNSPPYQEALQYRLKGGNYRGFIIQGV